MCRLQPLKGGFKETALLSSLFWPQRPTNDVLAARDGDTRTPRPQAGSRVSRIPAPAVPPSPLSRSGLRLELRRNSISRRPEPQKNNPFPTGAAKFQVTAVSYAFYIPAKPSPIPLIRVATGTRGPLAIEGQTRLACKRSSYLPSP